MLSYADRHQNPPVLCCFLSSADLRLGNLYSFFTAASCRDDLMLNVYNSALDLLSEKIWGSSKAAAVPSPPEKGADPPALSLDSEDLETDVCRSVPASFSANGRSSCCCDSFSCLVCIRGMYPLCESQNSSGHSMYGLVSAVSSCSGFIFSCAVSVLSAASADISAAA